jgi:hypothetical protein
MVQYLGLDRAKRFRWRSSDDLVDRLDVVRRWRVFDGYWHKIVNKPMDYSRASRENTHTVQRMRMEKSSEKVA